MKIAIGLHKKVMFITLNRKFAVQDRGKMYKAGKQRHALRSLVDEIRSIVMVLVLTGSMTMLRGVGAQ
jgi:hypothetical protein